MAIAGVDALDIAHAGRTIRTRLAPRHPAAVRPPTPRRRALARPPLRARRARTGSTCTGTSPRRRRGRSSCICTPADSSRARRVARAGRFCCSSPHTADAPSARTTDVAPPERSPVATRRRPRDRVGGRARRSPRRRHAADLRISRTARRRPVVFTHIPDPPRRLVAGHDRARRARHRARPRAGARDGRDDPRGILVTRPPTPSCPRRSTDSTCPSCPGHHAPPASLSAARSARERPPPI